MARGSYHHSGSFTAATSSNITDVSPTNRSLDQVPEDHRRRTGVYRIDGSPPSSHSVRRLR